MAQDGTSSNDINRFDKNLMEDVNDYHLGESQWTHARNAINNSRTGDLGKLGNEPSNLFCIKTKYTIIGTIHLYADKWAIFSTDNIDSEIGLFIEDRCEYIPVVNAKCLNFSTSFLIKGVSKATSTCTFKIYWDDGLNESRALEFDVDNPPVNLYTNPNSPIPWIQNCNIVNSCNICVNTPDLDCPKIRLARYITAPCVQVNQGVGTGTLQNGSYMVAVAYSIGGNKVSDYYTSNIQALFLHQDNGSTIDVTFSNVDLTFEEMQIVVIYVVAQQAVARLAGTYSTRQQRISFDTIYSTWPVVPLETIPLMTPIVNRSDAMYTISDYLIRSGTISKEDFNYQPLANQIIVKWQSVEYPTDYYRKGGNKTNYMRDEIYSFFIRWIYDTGDKSAAYHIPGRPPRASELVTTTTDALPDEVTGGFNYTWVVENTASNTPGFTPITLPDGGVIIDEGLMAYWESSEKYPDNAPQIWNSATNPLGPVGSGFNTTVSPYNQFFPTPATDLDLCGKSIRHHKFPDLYITGTPGATTTRYLNNDATRIRLMGVVFDNIKPPLMNDGVTPIPNIVGYEILRGTRNGGNKSILAKGLVRNMLKYELADGSKPSGDYGYFVNYPYNDLNEDPFLTTTKIEGNACSITSAISSLIPGQSANPLNQSFNAVSRDFISFHSPETSFQDPFLSAKELKIAGEMNGNVVGQFDVPEEHPKHKLITNYSFLLAFVSGIGIALLSMNGKRRTKYIQPKIPGYSESNIPGDGYQTDNSQSFGPISWVSGTSTGTLQMLSSELTVNQGPGQAYYSSDGSDNIDSSPREQDTSALDQLWSDFATEINAIVADEEFGDVAQGIIEGKYVTSGDDNSSAANQGTYTKLFKKWQDITQNTKRIASAREKQIEVDDSESSLIPKDLRNLTQLPIFLTNMSQGSDTILNLIKGLVSYRDYALRYHSHCLYSRYLNPRQGVDKRYLIDDAQYIGSQITNFNSDLRVNNLFRSRTVAIKLNDPLGIPNPIIKDVTKLKASNVPDLFNSPYSNSLSFAGNFTSKVLKTPYGVPFGPYSDYSFSGSHVGNVQLPAGIGNAATDLPLNGYPVPGLNPYGAQIASSQFVSLKQRLRNQYGQISGINIVPASYCSFPAPALGTTTSTSTVFGGDTYVTRYTEKNTFFYFYDWLYGQPDGAQLDYKMINMIPFPRFFANFNQFETGDFVQSLAGNLLNFSTLIASGPIGILTNFQNIVTPSDYYNLDGSWCTSTSVLNILGNINIFKPAVKYEWFYLFNSGVIDFFTESEINVDLRDWGEEIAQRHYDPYRYTDTKSLFETGIIKSGNYYKYDYSLSIAKLFINYSTWAKVQPASYNPYIAETCFIENPTRVIYSLTDIYGAAFDNWYTFLPNNYYDFISRVTAIKAVNKSGALFFFEDLSPLMFQGLDQLQTTSGTALTIGDGQLFSQPNQNIINAERPFEYASCQDRMSVINTPAGVFWMSQNQGKIFNYSNGLAEVSMQDLKWWLISYLPYKLLEDFPDFEILENPIVGIGCQSIYDNQNGLVYFCKRDYKLRRDLPASTTVTYDSGYNFTVTTEDLGSFTIKLGNLDYFEDASWTISYDPKTKGWVSYHDWHPNLTLPGKNTFLTVKDDKIWLHNYRTDSYCNYYDKDYPWEVEYMANTAVTVNTLRSIEYQLECYKYAPNMFDRFHVLDYNFDEAVVYNTEQVSGLLKLNLSPKKDPFALIDYPKINFDSIDILFSKEENRYRFNQFWDITADRGEYSPIPQRMIWNTAANGYVRTLNPNNMNYNKDPFQRKKFRHYTNSVFLRKKVSGDKKMLILTSTNKNLYSPR